MNNTLIANLNLITASTAWFINLFGIDSPEFEEALVGSTLSAVSEYYAEKGIEFNIESTEIEAPAMMHAYDRIMSIAKLAEAAALLGMKPEDFQD